MTGRQIRGKLSFFMRLACSRKTFCPWPMISPNNPQSENAHTKINTVSESKIDARQFGAHDLGKNDRIDDDHRQRIEHGPGCPNHGVPVFGLKLTLDASQNKTAIGQAPLSIPLEIIASPPLINR